MTVLDCPAIIFVKTPVTVGAVRGCGYTRLGGAPIEGYMLTGEKTCSRCGESKPLSKFWANKRSKDGKRSECSGCTSGYNRSPEARAAKRRDHAKHKPARNEYSRQRYRARPGEYADRWQEYYQDNREELVAASARRRRDEPGRASEISSRSKRKRYRASRAAFQAQERDYLQGIKALVFEHYGAACACCGSEHDLTIDHVNGDGKEHRREFSRSWQAIYRWLINTGFPEGFQTLCRPCNASKGRGVSCRLDHSVQEVA